MTALELSVAKPAQMSDCHFISVRHGQDPAAAHFKIFSDFSP